MGARIFISLMFPANGFETTLALVRQLSEGSLRRDPFCRPVFPKGVEFTNPPQPKLHRRRGGRVTSGWKFQKWLEAHTPPGMTPREWNRLRVKNWRAARRRQAAQGA
ncbi:MAG: hypothetical protein AB1705_25115 [Verrucomicrobiota bacterium]